MTNLPYCVYYCAAARGTHRYLSHSSTQVNYLMVVWASRDVEKFVISCVKPRGHLTTWVNVFIPSAAAAVAVASLRASVQHQSQPV